jgi:hydrogenase nickel incorporation protein HypA/HybF
MHEISLVRSIFETLEEQFTTDELQRIDQIQLKVGPLANVETVLLQNAFDAVVAEEQTSFAGVELHVNLIPILIECRHCGQQSEVENYRFVCAHCGTPCANVVQGNELLIEKVVMKD